MVLSRRQKTLGVMLMLFIPLTLLGVGWAASQLDGVTRSSHRVVQKYPHDRSAFTQGLVVENGVMYEGTGHYGKSELRRIDITTGKVLQSVSLPERYFGEGIALANGELFQLTWKERLAIVFDPDTLEVIRTGRYSGEGWGLTFDGTSLIMSDGSSTLRFLDPETFKVTKRITVRDGRRSIKNLNELEFVNGEIWANIWYEDQIVRIDPADGRVTGWVDLGGLKPILLRLNREAVYNGIAYDESTGKLYVTGKNWPNLFEIEITQ